MAQVLRFSPSEGVELFLLLRNPLFSVCSLFFSIFEILFNISIRSAFPGNFVISRVVSLSLLSETWMPFSCIHNYRHKLWSTILDIGESRLRASFHHSQKSDYSAVQQALEEYCEALDRCIGTCLSELGLPDPTIHHIITLLGSAGLSLLESEAISADRFSLSSSYSLFREVD